ncbi:MAG: response regulator [Myxococcaceae bacterium]
MTDTAQSKIRVFVVEDQAKILKNQLKVLETTEEIEIVGTALSGESALEELAKLAPDVLLLDLGLPRMDGIEVTRRVKQLYPKVEVLIFTIFDEEEKVLAAIQAGASGYLLKGAPAEKMVEAIRDVASGGTVIQPTLARRLLHHFRAPDASGESTTTDPEVNTTPQGSPTKQLSEREREILQLVAKGASNSEAAKLLNISKATIRTHLEHIYRKLDVNNRVEAVTEGIRQGIVSV